MGIFVVVVVVRKPRLGLYSESFYCTLLSQLECVIFTISLKGTSLRLLGYA